MSHLSLRLPDSLHRKLRELSERDDVSINQFIATAVAEKAAALLTVEYLEERGRRANPELIDRILSRVPNVPPIPGDALPPSRRASGLAQTERAARPTARRKRRRSM
jgi:predicted transcriptional regulator